MPLYPIVESSRILNIRIEVLYILLVRKCICFHITLTLTILIKLIITVEETFLFEISIADVRRIKRVRLNSDALIWLFEIIFLRRLGLDKYQ